MNKKSIAIASLILAIISLVPMIFAPNSLDGAIIYTIVFIIIAVVAVILGFVGKSASKGLGVAGIVIGMISVVLLGLAVFGYFGMKNATNCVDQGNGTYKCELLGQETEVPASFVREDQIKK